MSVEDDEDYFYNFVKFLQTAYGDHTLSAMTSGIRNNWMQAIQKCMDTSTVHRTSAGSAAASPSNKRNEHVPGSRRLYSASNGVSPEGSASSSSYSNSCGALYKNQTESSIAHHSPSTYSSSSSRDSTPGRPRRHEEGPTTPRSASYDKYSSRFSTENAGDESGRSASEPRRRFSSTWPYNSPESSPVPESEPRSRGSRSRSSSRGPRTPRSRSSSQNRSRRSSISDLLDEQGDEQRELTENEERELDNVQANIRRIHRKSITDSVSISKLPHLDKFEQHSNGEDTPERRPSFGSRERRSRRGENESRAIEKEQSVSYNTTSASRELFASPGRGRSPGRSRSPGRPSWTPGKKGAEERSKSPSAPRAPSAKVKDKSRSKSPRPRSPPPKLTTSRNNDDYFDSLEKWKENRWVKLFIIIMIIYYETYGSIWPKSRIKKSLCSSISNH